MTKQYDNELKGVLFKNDEKEDGSSAPDYKGNATVKGVDYFMDAWINTADTGRRYMSVKFKAKDKQRGASAPAPAPAQRRQSRDDDPPF